MQPTGEISRRAFIQRGGAAALSASALGSLLAACGSDSGGGAKGGGAMLKMTNDKIAWKDWFVQAGKAAKTAGAIGWNPVEYSDTTTYQAAIKTTGNTPKVSDMFSWWSGWLMKELVDANMLADVSSIWHKNGSAYSDGLRDAFTFEGKQYGVPLNVAYWVTFYNKHTFEKHKLDVPKTWEEFTGACDKLKAAKVTPLAATIDGRWPSFDYFQEFMIRKDPALYTALVDRQGEVHRRRRRGRDEPVGRHDQEGVLQRSLGGHHRQRREQLPTVLQAGQDRDGHVGRLVRAESRGRPASRAARTTARSSCRTSTRRPGATSSSSPARGVSRTTASARTTRSRRPTGSPPRQGQEQWIKVTGFTTARSDVPSVNPVDKEIDDDDQGRRAQADQPLLGGDAARHRRGGGRPVQQVHAQARRPGTDPADDPKAGGSELGEPAPEGGHSRGRSAARRSPPARGQQGRAPPAAAAARDRLPVPAADGRCSSASSCSIRR